MDAWGPWIATAVAVLLLAAIATSGLGVFRIRQPRAALFALARAIVQLGLLSIILNGIIRDSLWVGVGLAVMFISATVTAARRGNLRLGQAGPLAIAMLLGPLLAMTIVFITGAIEFSPRYVLAIGGIVIGNTMTVAILTDRVFSSAVQDHWDEVEGWLALGATPRQSTAELGRNATHTALLPSVDQTRTTGIVILPGAFVGAIFAGASPLEAGRFQIVVLACILAAGTVTSLAVIRMWSATALRPAEESR